MSKMSDLAYDIEQLYIEGHSPRAIAQILECPVDIVYEWIEDVGMGGVVETPQDADFDPFSTVNS